MKDIKILKADFHNIKLAMKGIFVLLFVFVGVIPLCSYLVAILSMPVIEIGNSSVTLLSFIGRLSAYINFYNFKNIFSFNDLILSSIFIAGHLLIMLITYLVFITEQVKRLKVKKTYEVDNKYGSHGTNEWLSDELISDIYKDNDKVGWFLGSTKKTSYDILNPLKNKNYLYHSVNNKAEINMQMIVVGPPGSKKTTGWVLPNLHQIPLTYKQQNLPLPDLVCIDPKPELTPMMYKHYENLGYDIKILDYINMEVGDTINNLYYLKSERDILRFANNYVNSFMGTNKNSNGDNFFPDSAINLLAAMTGYVLQKSPLEEQNMLGVLKLLQSEAVRDVEIAKEFFINEGLSGAPLFCWNNFLTSGNSPETYASILVTLSTNMSLFAFKEVQNLSEKNTCNIKLIGRKISSQEEIQRTYKIRDEANNEYEKLQQELTSEIEDLANQVLDSIEELLQISISIRINYNSLILQYSEQLADEQFQLMRLEAEEKRGSKKAKDYQNRQEEIRVTSNLISAFSIRKKEIQDLLLKKSKEKEEAEKEIENLKLKPTILFIWMSDDDDSLEPLVNVTTNTILRQLYTNARETEDNSLEVPVYFIFEEFNNIGKLQGIEKKLGSMRSRKIYPMIIIQSLAQLKEKYEKEWENILSQCDTHVFLGVNDNFTAEYLSTSLGSQTIRVYSGTDNLLGDPTEYYQSMQEQFQSRKLKEIDELRRLNNDNSIILARGLNPLFLYKCQFEYWKNGWKEKMKVNVKDLRKIGELHE